MSQIAKGEDFDLLADQLMDAPPRPDDNGNPYYLVAFSPKCFGMVIAALRLTHQTMVFAPEGEDVSKKLH